MSRFDSRRLVFSIAIACSVLLGILPCTAANVPPNGAITNPAPEGYYVDYSDADQIKPLQIPDWGFDDDAFTHGNTVYDVSSAGEFYTALSAASSSGGIIQIAAGSYTLDSKAVIPSNIIIQGAGVDQTTLVFGSGISADTSGLEAKYQTNIVLRDLTVDANDTSFIAISIRMCNNVLIERLVCRDGGRLGIRLPSTTKWTVRYVETYNHAQLHGLAASVETADADPGTEWPSYFSVYSSKMYNCGDHGLDLHAEYGEVAGCHIYGNVYGQSKQPDSVEVYLHNILYGDGSNYATRTYGTKRATSSMVYYYDIKYGGGYTRAAHIGGENNGEAPGQSFWSYNTYGSGSKLSVSNGTVYIDPASSAEAGTSGTTAAPQAMIDAINALRNTQGELPAIDSFTASPTSITAGQSATLSWSTANATSVDINHGVGTELPSEASTSVSPITTTTYTLTATGPGGTNTATVTVEVGSSAQSLAAANKDGTQSSVGCFISTLLGE
jgi:hypothetical protein